VQTSLERPLAGQSKNLFNAMAELSVRGVSARVLYNYFGDRISDVGSNEAPDIIEQGRGSLDVVLAKRFGKVGLRLTLENLTDAEHLFTQGSKDSARLQARSRHGLLSELQRVLIILQRDQQETNHEDSIHGRRRRS
jgi:hypothetical protein